MFANRSHVKYEFTNTKKLVRKLARIETSSICRQQFANMFANCLPCEGHFSGNKSQILTPEGAMIAPIAFTWE